MTEIQRERNRMLVKALRSNKYNQIEDGLIGGQGHCCLGVACDIYIQQNPTEASWSTNRNDPGIMYDKNEDIFDEDYKFIQNEYAPGKVAEWYGWKEGNPELKVPAKISKIPQVATECNDELNMTFKQIANAFERTFVKV